MRSDTEKVDTAKVDTATGVTWLRELSSAGSGLSSTFVWHFAALAARLAMWAGLAWVVQELFTDTLQGQFVAPNITSMTVFALAALIAQLASWGESRARERHRRAIRTELAHRVAHTEIPARPNHRETLPPNVATASIGNVADYLSGAFSARYTAGADMLVIVAIAALAYWPAALILALTAAIMPLNLKVVGLMAAHQSAAQLGAHRTLSARIQDVYDGVATLARYRRAGRMVARIDADSAALASATHKVVSKAILSGVILDALGTFALAVVASFVGFALLGYLPFPILPPPELGPGLFVLLLAPMFFQPLRAIAAAFHDRDRADSSAQLLGWPGAANRGPGGPVQSPVRDRRERTTAPVGIEVHELRVEGTAIAFDHVSIEPGTLTVVTGASGSGKTTLLKHLAGFIPSDRVRWHPDSTGGEVMAPELGSAVWLGNSTVVLSGSVAENLRLGNPDASEEEMKHALDAVGLWDPHILPGGVDFSGLDRLSAGERQRLAVARMTLARSGLWFLDEPTAHLDAGNAAQVFQAILEASRGATVVLATHVEAAVEFADAHLHLERGAVQGVRV